MHTYPRSFRPLSSRRAVAALFALVLAGALAHAQEGRFGGETSVLVVEIPVQVTLDGKPVRGLTAENFVVQQGKRQHPVASFEEIDLAQAQPVGLDVGAGVPAAARRHFLLLFDLSFADPGGVVRARQAARQVVTGDLHPSDLVAVSTYSESAGAKLVLGFTSDRRQVEAALETLGLNDPIEQIRDPLKLMIAGLEDTVSNQNREFLEPTTGPTGGVRQPLDPDIGTRRQELLLQALRDTSSMNAKTTREFQVNQVLAMSSSLEELAGYMSAVDGRKHVVFFSEGFDSSLLLGTEDTERLGEISQEAQFGQFWRVDSNERYGNSAGQRGLFQMLERFRRSDCAIQAVDLGGVRAGGEIEPRASGQDGLFIMANQTGGEFYRNYNNLGEAMGDLLERTSVTYLLTIQPQQPGSAGDFHPLKIKLKKAPKGAQVVHRPGYYTPTPFSALDPTSRQLETATQLLSGPDGGPVLTSVLAAPIRKPSGDAAAMTLIEIDGPSLMDGDPSREIPAEIFAYAIDGEGRTRDFFSQSVVLDQEKVGGLLSRRGFKLLASFDLPPGEYRIRALVRNARTGSAGLRTVGVTIPDFRAGETALLPPLFIEPDGTWILGHARTGDSTADFPLMNAGRPIIPAALPAVPVETPIPLLLMGHRLSMGSLAVSGTLTSHDGSRAGDAQIVLTRRLPLDSTGLDRLTATFQTGSVSPGRYQLQVTLTDQDSGQAVSSSIPILAF